ncbi:hypothetical protein DRW07_13420 [Alteromonas sediminis]|uniref:Solute-binding protein family 3/N-terminal domain-containing protein n=1 Tax=Alteromonas sediminis TaxID=2259342 RepID=A0A3N5Z9D2_9ALTE|nr:hypothetical protein [Alteromonas sediminis]RPJ65808.1 hypothetical protein DRW07_13420 [Alteromonas sediminis]
MQIPHIRFWNGNKSTPRRMYEKALIAMCLQHAEIGDFSLHIDETDYPKPEDEGQILDSKCDVLVTVEGNSKFAGQSFIKIDTPLCNDLLSHRLCIIRSDKQDVFSVELTDSKLRRLKAGIPATWADADILRYNECHVVEQGDLNHILEAIHKGDCDYIPLGAIEIEAIMASGFGNQNALTIEANHIIHYPLPLVFYVAPRRPELVSIIEFGLNRAMSSGDFQQLFEHHFPSVKSRLNLATRKIHTFSNPKLTDKSVN